MSEPWLCVECGGTVFHTLKCPVAKLLRGSWCTPKWLADLIGRVELDPCSNERSRIDTAQRCTGRGQLDDGLRAIVPAVWRVFINPPYGPGEVVKWVRHYRHTCFIFLLRWDPSTEWFDELIGHCTHVWFPAGRRVNFEPPPRIESSSATFPHALFLRAPTPELLTRLGAAGRIFVGIPTPLPPLSST